MTIAVIAPLAGQWMVEMAVRQRHVGRKQADDFIQFGIKALAALSGLFAFVIAFEPVRIPNRPH